MLITSVSTRLLIDTPISIRNSYTKLFFHFNLLNFALNPATLREFPPTHTHTHTHVSASLSSWEKFSFFFFFFFWYSVNRFKTLRTKFVHCASTDELTENTALQLRKRIFTKSDRIPFKSFQDNCEILTTRVSSHASD
jgi:hypothetical protein